MSGPWNALNKVFFGTLISTCRVLCIIFKKSGRYLKNLVSCPFKLTIRFKLSLQTVGKRFEMGGGKVIFPHGLHLAALTQSCHGKSHWVCAIQHCIFLRHIIHSFFFFPPVWLQEVEGPCDGEADWGPIRPHQGALLWSYSCEASRRSFLNNPFTQMKLKRSWILTVEQLPVFVISPLSGSVLTLGNILYVFLFGWWISLIYLLICPVMCLTIFGVPYGLYFFFLKTAASLTVYFCLNEEHSAIFHFPSF